ncbi:MAG TPA: fused MFS/spermidine synthase [Gemmatimonadaceae bacterium]|nr:fused MFS/spermidine synthase [Gemmatimonadaceae bacterium]
MTTTAMLYAIFLLSGAAGLIYESIWTRYLGLFVGHSAYAQVIVLVIFLGGMSLGSYLIGRRTLTIRKPLVWYAIVELVIGAIGLLFHQVFVGVTGAVYDNVFPALGHGVLLTAVKWSIAALLILPQSVLLGMTFPLMSAGVVRRLVGQPGKALSMLYFTNSAGASIGVLFAGFWLVARAGLPGTLTVAAVINLVVALAVLLVSRLAPSPGEAEPVLIDPAAVATPWKIDRRWVLLIATSFATAMSSFIYEIGWIRMLSLVLGSATHSFELMLSAFILGLALGAWWIGRRVDLAAESLRTLGRVQLAMGALALATLPVYLASFGWMASFIAAFARTNEGYLAFSIGRYAICLAVMLPATICAGMTLPLITRALIQGSAGERAIGQVYAVNTLGSIVGAGLAGLILMPLLGVKWLLITGAVIDLVVGGILIAEAVGRAQLFTPRRMMLTTAGIAVLGVIVQRASFDQTVLSSGVYRHGVVRVTGGWPVLFYEDGRTATVSVRRVPSTGIMTLATNGKSDASIHPAWMSMDAVTPGPLMLDMPTQLFIPLLPLAHAPHAKTAAVIGQGSGMTTHALLGSPTIERVVTIEIEPVMIEASRMFEPANRRAFRDPRSHFEIDDARAYFAAEQSKFDLILAEPSNPWVSGVSGLFTTEFYSRVKERLTPDGVFAQWLQTYEISDDLILSVLAAIDGNFPSWEIFATSSKDVLIIASPTRLATPDWSVMKHPGVASDLRFTWPVTPATLERMRIADKASIEPLLRRMNNPNSDFFPTVDLNAERTRFMQISANGLLGLTHGVNLPAMIRGQQVGLGEPYAIVPGIERLRGMAINSAMRNGDPRGGPEASAAAERARIFDVELGAATGPADWRAWVRGFAEVAALRHGGMSGVADTAFFARVGAYLDRHRAPAEARAVVAFTRGVNAWDFAAAAKAADPLIRAAVRGDLWIDPDYLRDGAVMAMLRTGDRAGARDAFRALEARSSRGAGDLRSQLLLSWVLDSAGVPPPR